MPGGRSEYMYAILIVVAHDYKISSSIDMQCTLNRQSIEHKIWSHNTHSNQMNGENETKVHLFDTRKGIVVQYKSALVLQSQTAVTGLGRKKHMYTVKQIK